MVSVPTVLNRRKEWFTAARIPFRWQASYCCEDHFELEEDAENWEYYKFAGTHLKLKPHVVPHLHLVTPKKSAGQQFSDSERKRKREFLSSIASCKQMNVPEGKQLHLVDEGVSGPSTEHTTSAGGSSGYLQTMATGSIKSYQTLIPTIFIDAIGQQSLWYEVVTADPFFPSGPQFSPATMTYQTMLLESSNSTEGSSFTLKSVPPFLVSTYTTANLNLDQNAVVTLISNYYWNLLKIEFRFYQGLPREHYILVAKCSEVGKMHHRDVMIVFKKLLTNDSCERLAADFCLGTLEVSSIYYTQLPKINTLLTHFLLWQHCRDYFHYNFAP